MYEHRIEEDASNGNLDGIIFYNKIGGTFTTNVLDIAAYRGHLEIIKWLYENVQSVMHPKKDILTSSSMKIHAVFTCKMHN